MLFRSVTAMLDLAMSQGAGPVTLSGISERQKISLSYLEQLFGKLRRFGLVESVRGPGGGYYLAKKMDDITVSDIIQAVDETMDSTQCGGQGNCHDEHECMTHDLWITLNAKIFEYLSSIKLSHLVVKQCAGKIEPISDLKGVRGTRQAKNAAGVL